MLERCRWPKVVEQLERRVLLDAMPVGPEFRVNTFTIADQWSASVAMDAEGNSVIAWRSLGQDGSGAGVYAQRYNAAGAPLGGEFRVNTYTTGSQYVPSVAMDAGGNFVIAWTTPQDGSSYGVYAQRYNAAGAPLGVEFRVNNYTNSAQSYPSVAMDADGDFVIAWESFVQDGSEEGIYARRYSAAGTPIGGEFRVNLYTPNRQYSASAAMDADGDFVIAWESQGQDGSNYGVYAQRFNAAGVRQGGEFRVNTYTIASQGAASVAMDADGDFVIAWSGEGNSDFSGVYAQRYNAAGNRLGDEFRVNATTANSQARPAVALNADGGFVVAWQSGGQDGSDQGVYAQSYDAAGVPQGGELLVNTYTTGAQWEISIAMDADGDFASAWTSKGQDGSDYGIYAQRFTQAAAPSVTASSFLFESEPQRLSFAFNQDVGASLDPSDIIVQALPAGPPVNPTAVSFDPATNTATFRFAGILPDANFRATLRASGITNMSGTPMTADDVFEFFFLMADANRDGRVNLADFNILAGNFGQSPRTFTQGDFNYDGAVNLQDFNILAVRFGTTLGPGAGRGDLFGGSGIAAGEDEAPDDVLALV